MLRKNTIILTLGGVLLVIATAAASVYVVKHDIPSKETVRQAPSQRAAAQPKPNCDDGNIVGKAVGGVGGGIAGSMIGKGGGKTAATIGGTLGGAYVGGEVIPLNNVTCR